MKTKTIELYDYNELSEDAKRKAFENHEPNFDFLEEDLNEYLNQLLQENGINGDATLYYNLNCSQSDHVTIEGNFDYKGVYFSIGNGYIELENDDDDDLKNDIIEALEIEFKELIDEIENRVKKTGYEIIEYENSEENFKDLCEANEYTFEIDGTMNNL